MIFLKLLYSSNNLREVMSLRELLPFDIHDTTVEYTKILDLQIPGLIKLFGDGGTSNAFVMLGEEKSSISSL